MRVQHELDTVINNSEIRASDRPKLPFTEATLREIMRCGPVGPIAATRYPREDCKVGRFVIPAGTIVFPNLYSMTKDPQLWGEDVDEFKPLRFLSEDGKSLKNEWWDFTFGSGNNQFCMSKLLTGFEAEIIFLVMRNNTKKSELSAARHLKEM